jgi:hypothetical protein
LYEIGLVKYSPAFDNPKNYWLKLGALNIG